MSRLSRPDEQASAIAFLPPDDASYVAGATIVVYGGSTARGGCALPSTTTAKSR